MAGLCIPVVCPLWPGPSRPLSTERELSSQLTPAAGSLTASESRHRGTGSPGNPGTARTSSTGQLLSDRNNNIGICGLSCSHQPATPRDGRNPPRINKKQNNTKPRPDASLLSVLPTTEGPASPGPVCFFVCPCLRYYVTGITGSLSGSPQNNHRGLK